MKYVYDDGGRAAAGFKGETGDCVCRAISIATGRPYAEIYRELNEACKKAKGKRKSSARTGISPEVTRAYMASIGWEWVPTMTIGSGCKVHLRDGELPDGRIIAKVTSHVVAVIDGVIHDNHDPSRGGTRCVYGYYREGGK